MATLAAPIPSTAAKGTNHSAESFKTNNYHSMPELTVDTHSSPSSSNGSDTRVDGSPDWGEQAIWDSVDALYGRLQAGGRRLRNSLIYELDGGTFGVSHSDSDTNGSIGTGEDGKKPDHLDYHDFNNKLDLSTNRTSLRFPKPPSDRDDLGISIPHFPDLTAAVLETATPGIQTPRPPMRTSEPISTGIQSHREKEMMGHITKGKFRTVLDREVGLARFSEWIDTEGYSGSKVLLHYYQDALAHATLLDEVSSVTDVMQGLYFGPGGTSAAWTQLLLSTRPSDCLYALGSASLSMRSAQTEAFDKLYAAEFKRFLTGQLSSHARFCMEHYADWRKRGDLGEVFCLVDPHLPDQPMIMLSDGFCRLTEYPREALVGRNCRFLQGPATDQDSVALLRKAVKEGREHCSMLMNYTRTGKAFWNLFNMIPLRNADGGIDYFLGAQVDCSQMLTSPATFQSLTGIAEGDRSQPAHSGAKFAYSQDLLSSADEQLPNPTLLRKITKPSSNDRVAVTNNPRFVRADGNRHSGTRPNASTPSLSSQSAQNPLEPIPIPQEVPNPVRDHMSAFSSAYSKLFILSATDRRILYITAPLLSHLGYPVKSMSHRLSPRLLKTDLLDSVTGESPAQAATNKAVIRRGIEDQATHSVFVDLIPARPSYLSSMAEDPKTEGQGHVEDRKYLQCLLHLTPLKNKQHQTGMYAVVVG